MNPQPLRILLVEDDENLIEMLELTFDGREFVLDVARNGLEGVEKAVSTHPDLVLMDVVMPEMDGCEAARRIRAKAKDIPIFFLTAKSMEQDIQNGKKTGGEMYLVKPFSPFELIEIIHDYFHNFRPQISA